MLLVTLLLVNSLFFVLAAVFLYESIRKKEPRALKTVEGNVKHTDKA
jgi:hypothetical protein